MSCCHYLIITGKFGYNLGVYDGNSLIPIIALKTNGTVSVENINWMENSKSSAIIKFSE